MYTYERKTNGEKAVDTKIIAKGVSHVVQQEVPATLNLLSGDLDMLPLVEEALERNWNVTLWSWQDSLSKDYSNMDKVEVKHLDDIA
ncbi:NYN domain-containing protein, partial [Streptococcus pyogenes]